LNGAICGLHITRSHLEGQTRRRVGCTPSRSRLGGQTRWCVGCTPPRWHLEGQTRRRVECTPPRWPLERHCRGEGAQTPSSSPRFPLSLSFPLVLPPPTPFSALLAPSVFVTWPFDGGRFLSCHATRAVVVGCG
jgi:hypothetical protein